MLFLQGGAFALFTLVPLNLLASDDCAGYLDTGHWSARAIAEASRVSRVAVVARARNAVPPAASWEIPAGAAYFSRDRVLAP